MDPRLNISRRSGGEEIIPPRSVTVVAKDALRAIDSATEALAAWGVRIPAHSRFEAAREILQVASETGILVPTHRGDDLGLRALEFVHDYAAIAQTLPPVRVTDWRRDLENSLRGPLSPRDGQRGPLQLQSQAIVRAIFVRAGLSPIHPTPPSGTSSPDFVLVNGTLSYAVEAKRPERAHNALPRFIDGCTQLRGYDLSGGVVVDLADCGRGLPQKELDRLVHDAAEDIYREVFVIGRGHRMGYSHIMFVGLYARPAWVSADGPREAMVGVHTSSRCGVFARQAGTLPAHRAKWLREHFVRGLAGLTGLIPR